jgi:protein SSD1
MMGQFGAGGFGMPAPGMGGYGMPGMSVPNMDTASALGLGLSATPGTRGGHGRRHSMNVINKNPTTAGPDLAGMSSNFAVNNLDGGYDDGFAPPAVGGGGHSRQPSRADPSWRNGTLML